MSPDHPLAPLLQELCPKRYPRGRLPELALDPVEIYELACALGAHGVVIQSADDGVRVPGPQ